MTIVMVICVVAAEQADHELRVVLACWEEQPVANRVFPLDVVCTQSLLAIELFATPLLVPSATRSFACVSFLILAFVRHFFNYRTPLKKNPKPLFEISSK